MHINTYFSKMRYTYDPKKWATNLKMHGYDFEDAPQVIEVSRTVTLEDRRFKYGEQHFVTLGVLREDVVVITNAEKDEEIRVISTRKAERNEQEIYYSKL